MLIRGVGIDWNAEQNRAFQFASEEESSRPFLSPITSYKVRDPATWFDEGRRQSYRYWDHDATIECCHAGFHGENSNNSGMSKGVPCPGTNNAQWSSHPGINNY